MNKYVSSKALYGLVWSHNIQHELFMSTLRTMLVSYKLVRR